MGQAKRRGTLETRIHQAQEKIHSLRPKSIACNSCNHQIQEIADLDVRGFIGIQAAFVAICPNCQKSTFAVDGAPERAAELLLAFEKYLGAEGQMSFQIKNPEEK